MTDKAKIAFGGISDGRDEYSDRFLEGFERMPKQAKGILLCNLRHLQRYAMAEINPVICQGCGSPIEYIYVMALIVAENIRHEELWTFYEDCNDAKRGICWDICPQYKIKANGKTYFADFLLEVDCFDADAGIDQILNIVIECDGYEYHHANKEQVQHDNERELAIKKAGYEVIRFSGSQIYNDPFKCANDTIDYIISEFDRMCLREGTNG